MTNAMPQAAALAVAEKSERYPLDDFLADISGIAATTEPIDLKRRSRDYFWYSPILYEMLKDKVADVVVTPRDEAEVVRVAAACARHRMPLTVRGGATGNYGQCVPLQGGVVLDMAALNRIEWQKPGLVRVEAGAKLYDIDAATRPNGFELRMHPSTKRSAVIGGFVAGGSGGVGSVTFGGMREPGNIVAARIVTLERRTARHRTARRRGAEDQPRLRHHRDHHRSRNAVGARAILDRRDRYLRRLRRGGPVWAHHRHGRRYREKAAIAHSMAAAAAFRRVSILLPRRQERADRHDRRDVDGKFRDAARGVERDDHLQGRSARTCSARCRSMNTPGITPRCRCSRTTVASLICNAFIRTTALPMRWRSSTRNSATKCVQHLEFIRLNGFMTASGIPIVRYRSPERLYEIIAGFEACGVMIANPHVVTLEDGSRYKRVDADQLGFKHEVDPMGLLNPGKMRSFVPQAADRDMTAAVPIKAVAESTPIKSAASGAQPAAAAAACPMSPRRSPPARGACRHRPDDLSRRIRQPARTVGLRKIDAAQAYRRARHAVVGRDRLAAIDLHRGRQPGTGARLRVPGADTVAVADGGRQCPVCRCCLPA